MNRIPELERLKNMPHPNVPQITFAGHVHAGLNLLRHRYLQRVKRYKGNARTICEHIISGVWNKKFYYTSLGHYKYFWVRDFGTVAESLMKLGHEERVHKTIRWALHHYRRSEKVTLCIDYLGQVFNAPEQSIDALPWLLHAIVVSGYSLSDRERVFLEVQLLEYKETFLTEDGMLHSGHYAELRDAVLYHKSAYAVAMIARMARCVHHLHLAGFPFPAAQYKDLLLKKYWNGHYFSGDAETDAFSAECALFPFVLDIFDDHGMATKTFDYINKERLNIPYPLHYTNKPLSFHYRWWAVSPLIMPNYAGTTIWTWHGVFYLQLLKKYNREEYASEYTKITDMIERFGTFPELLHPDGSWYKTPAYKGDEAMIWCAIYLALNVDQSTT